MSHTFHPGTDEPAVLEKALRGTWKYHQASGQPAPQRLSSLHWLSVLWGESLQLQVT